MSYQWNTDITKDELIIYNIATDVTSNTSYIKENHCSAKYTGENSSNNSTVDTAKYDSDNSAKNTTASGNSSVYSPQCSGKRSTRNITVHSSANSKYNSGDS